MVIGRTPLRLPQVCNLPQPTKNFRSNYLPLQSHQKPFLPNCNGGEPHRVRCPNWVRLGRSPGVPPTSEAGGEPEEIGCKAEIGVRTSEAEGIPDLNRTWPSGPSLASSGHVWRVDSMRDGLNRCLQFLLIASLRWFGLFSRLKRILRFFKRAKATFIGAGPEESGQCRFLSLV